MRKYILSAIGVGMLFTMDIGYANSQENFSPSQVKSIEKIVHRYLLTHPDVLVEVSNALQIKQMAAAQQSANMSIRKNIAKLFKNPDTPTNNIQSPSASMVEFFDYQCGHCKEMGAITNQLRQSDHSLQLIYKELPIFGENSKFAARAALASTKQGKYLAFHEALLKENKPLNTDRVMAIAKSVGLNTSTLKADMDQPWIDKQLNDNLKLAQDLKLQGTPAFIIANKQFNTFKFIPGATSLKNLRTLINKVRS